MSEPSKAGGRRANLVEVEVGEEGLGRSEESVRSNRKLARGADDGVASGSHCRFFCTLLDGRGKYHAVNRGFEHVV